MKKILSALIVISLIIPAALAQHKMTVVKKDNTTYDFNLEEVSHVTFHYDSTLDPDNPDDPQDPEQSYSNLYIVGDATPNGWYIDNPTKLRKTGDKTFVFEGYLVQGEMKAILSTGSWDVPFYRPAVHHTEISHSGIGSTAMEYYAQDDTHADNKWLITEDGLYVITFDLGNNTINARFVTANNSVFMIGDATNGGWGMDTAREMIETAPGSHVFTWIGDLSEGWMKACLERDGTYACPFIRPLADGVVINDSGVASPEMTITTNPDDKWHVTVPGRYQITIDLRHWTIVAKYLAQTIHSYKAPLYWNPYEYCYEKELAGASTIDITPQQWDEYLDWFAANFKPYGYDMVCTDGFCAMLATDSSGYMTQYGSTPLSELAAKCRARGLKLGIYDNPLWLHGDDSTVIPGTEYTFGSLKYDGSDPVLHPEANDLWFQWVAADHPGAEAYIDGFFRHYKEMGVEYIRMDFLSWYEDGFDRNMNPQTVGRGYGRQTYGRALQMVEKAARKYGVFVSLVMPHLYWGGNFEAELGQMVRIVSDTSHGGWQHTSGDDRGIIYPTWANCKNQFDGFIHWSKITGRGKVIPDGDFIRMSRYNSDAEKETVITLQLMAGGPITVTDQPSTIGDGNLKFYTNAELLALNTDCFVGKPLTDDINNDASQIWFGQMTDGSWVVALFNREDNQMHKSIEFSTLGIDGSWNIRDLWRHQDEGNGSSLSVDIPAHGCKVVKLTH